jgi:hypothetical protein
MTAPSQSWAVRCWRGLTIGCSGCGAWHVFWRMKVLRAGPAPLTLVSLGRWTGIATAAGVLTRGCRVFHLV